MKAEDKWHETEAKIRDAEMRFWTFKSGLEWMRKTVVNMQEKSFLSKVTYLNQYPLTEAEAFNK